MNHHQYTSLARYAIHSIYYQSKECLDYMGHYCRNLSSITGHQSRLNLNGVHNRQSLESPATGNFLLKLDHPLLIASWVS